MELIHTATGLAPDGSPLRAAMLVPWAIPTVVSAKMWSWMLHDQFGVVNHYLLQWGWIHAPIAWTADPSLSLFAIVLVDVWKTTPFMALLILAALQMVPADCYEAARVDGVPAFTVFRRITLPLISPGIAVAVVFRMLDALRVFDLIYVMTSNSRDTRSMSVFVREQLIDFQQTGYGSAAALRGPCGARSEQRRAVGREPRSRVRQCHLAPRLRRFSEVSSRDSAASGLTLPASTSCTAFQNSLLTWL